MTRLFLALALILALTLPPAAPSPAGGSVLLDATTALPVRRQRISAVAHVYPGKEVTP